MSDKRVVMDELRTEVRQMQKAAAVLGCIQCAAEYDKDLDLDFADAVASVRGMITAISVRLDALVTGKDG